MRLSEAMMLGSTITKIDSSAWNTCLLGVSVSAEGAKNFGNFEAKIRWPWISTERVAVPDFLKVPCSIPGHLFWHTHESANAEPQYIISCAAFHVENGDLTVDKVADWVRSVEPKEPKPRTESEQAALDANNEIAMQGHDRWLERSAGCFDQE
jgi:hypothetical protein